MDTTAPVAPRRLLAALLLGGAPAVVAIAVAPGLLRPWDLPIALGVLLGGLLMARRARAAQTPELPRAVCLPVALLVAAVIPAFLHLATPTTVSNDEQAYLLQAELFAEGRLAEPLRVNELVDFTLRRRQVHEDRDAGVRYAKYPPGVSAMLTPGVWLGWPPLVPVAAALASVLLTAALARRYGLQRPWIPALLLALSPFFLLVQGSFQSEAFTLVWALTAWWALLRARAGARWAPLLVGLACGLVFLCRPLTGVVAAVACGWGLLGAPARGRALTLAILGGLPCLAALLAYQAAQTGDPWTSPYAMYAQAFGPWSNPGAPPAERLPIDVYGNGGFLAGLGRQAARWSVGAGMLGLVVVGLLGLARLRKRDGGAGLLFALLLPVAYAFHWYPGHWAYLGPLYCYESLGLVLLGVPALLAGAPVAWRACLLLAVAAWGAIPVVPRFDAIAEHAALRAAPQRVAATLDAPAVLLIPFVSVPAMQEFGMKHWTPSRDPATEDVAVVRELPNPDHTRRALAALGLGGRPVYRLSPITDAVDGAPAYEALPAPDLTD